MKKIIYILILLIVLSCDTDNGSDCFKIAGKNITKIYELDEFSRVIFREGIELELIHGEENKIEITFGENLIKNVTTKINNNRLYIENSTSCNHIRNVESAKVILTVKDIVEIRNASQFKLFSRDTLRFESLQIVSENFTEKEVNSGDVNVFIDIQNFSIVTNGSSNFIINGKAENFNINFAAGQGKLGGNLIAQNIYVFHRGANEIIVNPIKELKGEIRSIGDVIAVNKPLIVEVEEFYTGKLIYRD